MPLLTINISDKAWVLMRNIKGGERSKVLSKLIEDHISNMNLERAAMYVLMKDLREQAEKCGFSVEIRLDHIPRAIIPQDREEIERATKEADDILKAK